MISNVAIKKIVTTSVTGFLRCPPWMMPRHAPFVDEIKKVSVELPRIAQRWSISPTRLPSDYD